MRVLVTGGTGVLGRQVVDRLAGRGDDVVVLSRRPGADAGKATLVVGDLERGTGLGEALDGVAAVVHCASHTAGARLGHGDAEATRGLLEAARGAGVGHVVYISIVGIDRVPFGYYKRKLATERVIETGGLPWTILRTTQWFDLIARLCAGLSRAHVRPRGLRFQPMDSAEVAGRMVELVDAGPSGRVPDEGGPEVLSIDEILEVWFNARGRRTWLAPVPLPGRTGGAFRAGLHTTPERAVGRMTWPEFLSSPRGRRLVK